MRSFSQRRVLRRRSVRPVRSALILGLFLLLALLVATTSKRGLQTVAEAGPVRGTEVAQGTEEGSATVNGVLGKERDLSAPREEEDDRGSELEKVLQKYKVEKLVQHPADFGNPVYDSEARRLLAGISPETTDPVELSLMLMARPGHRTRVTDTIGGNHNDPMTHKAKLRQYARVFLSSDAPLTPRSSRDFATNPVSNGFTCTDPVPCAKQSYVDGRSSGMTMENHICKVKNMPYRFCGTTGLISDVPLPYFSWHDFGIMKPHPQEPRTSLAAAFISNCSFKKRNLMVRDLVHLSGKRVKSYGSCERSEPEPSISSVTGRDSRKLSILETFKFSLAFENSETEDYITEKFFGSLAAGAVPVVIGAPNIKFWAPDTTPYPYESKALLYSGDFGDDAQRIAKLLLELDTNQEAYHEMTNWKRHGYSDDFKALGDLSDVHSSCRSCILIADDIRHDNGPNVYDVSRLVDRFRSNEHNFSFFIRERGSYAFTRIGFKNKPTMRELVKATLENINIREKNLWRYNQDLREKPTRVYAFYLPRPGRLAILSDEDIEVLPDGCEIEMIYV